MNSSIVRYVLGCVLKIEAVLLIIPMLVGVFYREEETQAFLITIVLCGLTGFLMTIRKPKNNVFYLKEGCVTTALSWIFMSIFGALPFFISGSIPDYIDALFETISGFTTTGASILSEIEGLPQSILFWRSFTHWIGGMGVLVFLLAVIPLTGGYNMNLMKAESPGPSVGKLVPKIKTTARLLYIIYFGLTVLQSLLLIAGRMPVIDAVNTAMATAGTGGFGIKNDSLMSYSPYIQWVVTIFMILFGVNFNAYYLIVLRQFKKAVKVEEVRAYFLIVFASTALIFANIFHIIGNVEETLRHSIFQVATVMTTTGFSTVDFDLWPSFSKTILVLLMFIGACAGSTGGGIKVSRFLIAAKTIKKEIQSYMHPKSVKVIKVEGKPVEHETIRSVNVYFFSFAVIFVVSLLVVSIEGNDLITNFTAVAATINNIGPGLSKVGPTCNFGDFNYLSKCVFMFDMLAGRLELFPLIILFHPSIWGDTIRMKISKTRWRKMVIQKGANEVK